MKTIAAGLILTIGTACVLLTIFAGAAAHSGVIARVDGVEITDDDAVLAFEDLGPALPQQMTPEQRREYIVNYLIDQKITARKAAADPQFPNQSPAAVEHGLSWGYFGCGSSDFRVVRHLLLFAGTHDESGGSFAQLSRVPPPPRAHGASRP